MPSVVHSTSLEGAAKAAGWLSELDIWMCAWRRGRYESGQSAHPSTVFTSHKDPPPSQTLQAADFSQHELSSCWEFKSAQARPHTSQKQIKQARLVVRWRPFKASRYGLLAFVLAFVLARYHPRTLLFSPSEAKGQTRKVDCQAFLFRAWPCTVKTSKLLTKQGLLVCLLRGACLLVWKLVAWTDLWA